MGFWYISVADPLYLYGCSVGWKHLIASGKNTLPPGQAALESVSLQLGPGLTDNGCKCFTLYFFMPVKTANYIQVLVVLLWKSILTALLNIQAQTRNGEGSFEEMEREEQEFELIMMNCGRDGWDAWCVWPCWHLQHWAVCFSPWVSRDSAVLAAGSAQEVHPWVFGSVWLCALDLCAGV